MLSVRETGALMEAHIKCHSHLESLHKWGPGGAIIVPVLRASKGYIRAPSLSPTFKTISPRNFNNLLPKTPQKSVFPNRQPSQPTKFSSNTDLSEHLAQVLQNRRKLKLI